MENRWFENIIKTLFNLFDCKEELGFPNPDLNEENRKKQVTALLLLLLSSETVLKIIEFEKVITN